MNLDFLKIETVKIEFTQTYDGLPCVKWTEEYKCPQLTLSILKQVAEYLDVEDIRVNYISDAHNSISGDPGFYGYEFSPTKEINSGS